MTDLETILSWFQTGDMPTEEEFQETFSSFRLKNTKIPIAEVDKLEALLNSKINADDYVKDGKIRADKIEALGLTELIESSEKDISEFAENSDKYEFQQNDFIAVPDDKGNFSLYIFKGGEKKDKSNYLPTGLTNITISMVENLQHILNGKIGKPLTDGSFFTRQNAGVTSQQLINPSANYLSAWNGSDFVASPIFTDGTKLGVGNSTPKEQLHLTGRAKMSALVLDENSENLPGQITRNEDRFFGTNSSGIRRSLMYNDFTDYKLLWQNLTDSEKTEIKTIANGGWTTATMNVFMINPIILKNLNNDQYITLLGTNLNFNPTNFIVEICTEDSTGGNYTVVKTIDNSKVQLYQDGLSLVFSENFSTYTLGKYKVRLTNGLATYLTGVTFEIVSTLNSYDLIGLTWTSKVIRDEILFDLQADSNGVYSKAKYTGTGVGDWNSSSTLAVCVSSSAFGNMSDDFFIEFTAYADSEVYRTMSAGLTNENTPVLANNLIAGLNFSNASTQTHRILVLKRGNFMTTVYKSGNYSSSTIQNVTTDANVPIKFKLCLIATDLFEVRNNLLIKSAYKLN